MAKLRTSQSVHARDAANCANAKLYKPLWSMSKGLKLEDNHLTRERLQINGQYVIAPPQEATPAGFMGDFYGGCTKPQREYPAEPSYIPFSLKGCLPCHDWEETAGSACSTDEADAPESLDLDGLHFAGTESLAWSHNTKFIKFL